MHYFSRNIGDYHKKAGRLNMLQHGAYTLLMDACYDRERFPTFEEAIEWCWASTPEEIAAVEFVLKKFFKVEDGLYVQGTIREEVQKYQENCLINKEIAIKREQAKRDKKARTVIEACTNEHEPAPNHKPITNNQEPLTNNQDINKTTTGITDLTSQIAEEEKVTFSKIQKLWNEILGDKLQSIRSITDQRKKHITARVREDDKRRKITWWQNYFEFISESEFLMGGGPKDPKTGKAWQAEFEWVINQNNMIKIIEGKYHHD
jgi:uncharacterized protein YdaU (DUF1376 family)